MWYKTVILKYHVFNYVCILGRILHLLNDIKIYAEKYCIPVDTPVAYLDQQINILLNESKIMDKYNYQLAKSYLENSNNYSIARNANLNTELHATSYCLSVSIPFLY